MSSVDPERTGAAQGADVVGRHKRLLARTLLISGLTLCSRILGYAREALTARLFGDTSSIYDAFVTGWRVPNLFRRLMGEGALSTSLQNAVTAADADRGDAAGRRVFLDTIFLATWILIAISLLVMGGAYLLGDRFPLTDWNWLGDDPAPVRELTLRLTPFLILACLAGLAGGALGVRGHFAAPTWGPAIMNVVVIATLGWILFVWGDYTSALPDPAAERGRQLEMARTLAWGTLLSGLALLVIQFPALRRHHLWPGRREPRDLSRAWRILRDSAPLALGAAVYQVNVMIDGLMAQGLLTAGGPTALYYANRIQQFPLALVATAATAAIYPALNAHGHKRDLPALRALHDRTHLAIVFLALPASVGMWVLARPIVSVLLEHGLFGAEGAERTAAALRWSSLALIPAGAVGLVSRAYYAVGDLTTPVRVSIAMLIANVLLNWSFVRLLGMDCDGLTLATAITNWVNLLILLPGFARLAPRSVEAPAVALPLVRVAIAAGACGLSAWCASRAVSSDPRSFLGLAAGIAAGGFAYALACHCLGVDEWRRALAKLRGRR